MVIVAQRVATLRDADHIFVLDEGRIAADGTHDELLANSDIYREIVHSQLDDQRDGSGLAVTDPLGEAAHQAEVSGASPAGAPPVTPDVIVEAKSDSALVVLQLAQQLSDRIVGEATAEAVRLRAAATATAERVRADAEAAAAAEVAAARVQADELLFAARAEADQVRAHADRLWTEAEQARI